MPGIGGRIAFNPEPWIIILGAGLIIFSFFIYRRTFPTLSLKRRILLAFLRACGFILLVLFIFNPVLITETKEIRRPLVLVLFDVSKSMSIPDCEGKSRIERAKSELLQFLDSLRGATQVETEIVPFASELADGAVEADSILDASGEGTDITAAVKAAQRRYRSKNLTAVVLLTDGRVSRGITTSSAGISVPIYAVGFGDTLESADVQVEGVYYERVAYTGTKTTIEVVVKAVGFKGRTVELQLVENGKVIDGASLSVGGDSEELNASLIYTPLKEGDHRLMVRAVPMQMEQRKENNEESVRIKVLKDRIRFLYLDQFADWNTTFIRDLVSRSKRYDIEAVTWIPRQGFCILPDKRSWSFPVNPSALGRYDLVVVSDDSEIFSVNSNAEVLEDYVRGGGGLLLLADENSPAARVHSMRLLERILPVRLAGNTGVELGEYYVGIAPGESENPFAAALAEGGRLDDLPPLLGRISGLVFTAGARVLLVMDDGKKSMPFLAIQRVEKGVSAIVLGFPVWRWRLAGREGEEAYNTFFGGLIQYLAEGTDSPSLEIDSDRTVYRTGDRIGLSVYIGGSRSQDGIRGEVLHRSDEGELLVRTFLFDRDPRRTGIFTADLGPLPPGEYRITASEMRNSSAGLSGETEVSVLPVSVEFLKTSRDVPFLRQIAEISGGKMLEGAELRSLPARMDLREDEIEVSEIKTLRASFMLFVGIILFLALEWILRKAWGLV